MKIVCDSCFTKYAVGDDRIAGKVFKIRCKKCSHVMIVRGAAAPVEAPVEMAAASGEWHVVSGGTQLGPMVREDLVRLHATGAVTEDALVWREGFADWQSYAAVDELSSARAPAHTPAEPTPTSGPVPSASAPEQRGGLIAERNESSVLFTLHNLAKLAQPTPAVTAASNARAAAGGPVTEGSGLIDIQALARTMVPDQPKAVAARSGSLDDIPDFAPANFGEPAVLVPLQRPGPDRKLVIALGASVGVLAIVAAILVIVMLRRDGTPTAEAATPPAPTPAVTTPPPQAAPPAATTPPPAAPQTAAPATHETAVAAVTPPPSSSKPSSSKPSSSKPSSSKPSLSKPSSSKPPSSTPTIASTNPLAKPVKPPEAENRCDKITCLVNGNADPCCAQFRDGGSSSDTNKPASNLPESLDKAAIVAGLGKVNVKSCSSPTKTEVRVQIRVAASGAVSGVTASSTPKDASLEGCVSAAVQRASFSKTQRGSSFAYVWRF